MDPWVKPKDDGAEESESENDGIIKDIKQKTVPKKKLRKHTNPTLCPTKALLFKKAVENHGFLF